MNASYIYDEKSRVFEAAHRLFSQHGFENVSIGTLAKTAGVKTSAVYYCGGKTGLLEDCYKFYTDHRTVLRPTLDQLKSVMRNGTQDEVLAMMVYAFPDEIMETMYNTLKIVLARIYIDERARRIYVEDNELALTYLREYFELGVSIGRLEPFDIETVSMLCLSYRLFTMFVVTTRNEPALSWYETDLHIFAQLKRLMPFKY